MKKFFFIAGLPRSGSTLLTDLLAQHPDFYCSPTSGVRDMVELIKNNWNGNEHFKAAFDIDKVNNMIKGTFEGYYSSVAESVVFDKSRGWPGSLELANLLSHEEEAKVIVTVRSMVDVVASLEKLYRKNAHNFMLPQEKANPAQFVTLEGRCEHWVSGGGMIGSSYNGILQAMKKGYLKQMLFVDYTNLCIEPEAQLERIYEFLGVDFEPAHHSYTDVVSQNYEYEMARGFPQTLHEVRPEVKVQKSDAANVLGSELFEKYNGSEFWKQMI